MKLLSPLNLLNYSFQQEAEVPPLFNFEIIETPPNQTISNPSILKSEGTDTRQRREEKKKRLNFRSRTTDTLYRREVINMRRTMIQVVREKLSDAVLQLYEIRLKADTEPHMTILLDTARTTIDECIEILKSLETKK